MKKCDTLPYHYNNEVWMQSHPKDGAQWYHLPRGVALHTITHVM